MKTQEHAEALARALREVSQCLENWMEIAEKDDKRQYDQDAIDAGQNALDAWNKHNATTKAPQCRQTACRFCGLDIENFAPYRAGHWRDRGNNTACPTSGNVTKKHRPTP